MAGDAKMEANQVILITGTSTGFGRLMSESLARKGHTVFASMRNVAGRNASNRAELCDLAETEDLSLHVVELDVTDVASVENAVDKVIEQAGRIDVLVNNAGVNGLGLNETFTVDQVQQMFDVNFFGVVRMNRAVLPHMRRQRNGLLLYISSDLGRGVLQFEGIYGASKFALEALAEAYHYDLYKLGIDTVIIEPGSYPTAMEFKTIPPGDPSRAAEYGSVAEIIDKSAAIFNDISSRPHLPNPQEVADAVVELVEMPREKLPLRMPVGEEFLVTPVNRAAEQMQAAGMGLFGLTELMKPTV